MLGWGHTHTQYKAAGGLGNTILGKGVGLGVGLHWVGRSHAVGKAWGLAIVTRFGKSLEENLSRVLCSAGPKDPGEDRGR